MLKYLKSHPFAVEAHFKSSIVLTFSIPKKELEPLIPKCLELDTFEDEWAFIAVALVQTKDLRPKGFPKCLGSDFLLMGYRIFVRYKTSLGKCLRGLYILKSVTNSKRMEFFGNVFTHYNYSSTPINWTTNGSIQTLDASEFKLQIEDSELPIELPLQSPFKSWKEARRYCGPLPFTFTFDEAQQEVLIIEGVRENWLPQPIKVLDYKFNFLEELNLKTVHFANAFCIKNIPYSWKKGKLDPWKHI